MRIFAVRMAISYLKKACRVVRRSIKGGVFRGWLAKPGILTSTAHLSSTPRSTGPEEKSERCKVKGTKERSEDSGATSEVQRKRWKVEGDRWKLTGET